MLFSRSSRKGWSKKKARTLRCTINADCNELILLFRRGHHGGHIWLRFTPLLNSSLDNEVMWFMSHCLSFRYQNGWEIQEATDLENELIMLTTCHRSGIHSNYARFLVQQYDYGSGAGVQRRIQRCCCWSRKRVKHQGKAAPRSSAVFSLIPFK